MDEIKARIIKTNSGCFISDCYACDGYNYNYHSSKIQSLYFDGEKPLPSFKKNWYVIKQFPETIQKQIPGEFINKRYEILDKDCVSAKLPEVIYINQEEFFDTDGDFKYPNLYQYTYDKLPDTMEDVEVCWDYVLDVEDFEMPPNIQFTGVHKWNYKDEVYKISNNSVHHQGLDEMMFPDILLHNRPSQFDSKTVYDITRQYVLEHIDHKVAEVTSNYDFCFTVAKRVPLIVPQTITYQNIFARTKKEREKVHTKIKSYNTYTIFEMTSENDKYQKYPIIPAMTANNEVELNEKMKHWLNYLIEEINRPLHECPQCNGMGFLVEDGIITANYN